MNRHRRPHRSRWSRRYQLQLFLEPQDLRVGVRWVHRPNALLVYLCPLPGFVVLLRRFRDV